MKKPFYVTDGLNRIGPFSKEEVLTMLYNATISIMDYVIDSRDNRMCPLLQHEDFGGEGEVHGLVGGKGIAGLTPKNLSQKFGFAELRQKKNVDRDDRRDAKKKTRPKDGATSHLQEVINAFPELAAKQSDEEKTVAATGFADEQTATTAIKNSMGTAFYVKIKDKEYGPIKYLILLSLLFHNKVDLKAKVRTEGSNDYRELDDFVPDEVEKTMDFEPLFSDELLPRKDWRRKNPRIEFEEIVLINNDDYCFVAKSIDLSNEGISVLCAYEIAEGEAFDISIFDLEKNIQTFKAKSVRNSPMRAGNIGMFRVAFVFDKKISLKSFIP